MKKLVTFLISLSFLGFAAASNAATVYDFALEGNVHEAGYAPFDSDDHGNGDAPHGAANGLPGGLSISASNGSGYATNPLDAAGVQIIGPASTQYEAYMDGKSSGNDAGLGVCHTIGSCAGISDDNQMQGEYIAMDFDFTVGELSLAITGDHAPVADNAIFHYSVDEGLNWLSIGFGTTNSLIENLLISGVTKSLDYTIEGGQMYLSSMAVSAVPVPAAVWLFGTAMAGLLGFRRRRNTA